MLGNNDHKIPLVPKYFELEMSPNSLICLTNCGTIWEGCGIQEAKLEGGSHCGVGGRVGLKTINHSPSSCLFLILENRCSVTIFLILPFTCSTIME